MKDYSFERLWKELDEGFQIYCTYIGKRYLLTKLDKNCYSREMIEHSSKDPHPKKQIITLKTVKEMYDFMDNIEYKVDERKM